MDQVKADFCCLMIPCVRQLNQGPGGTGLLIVTEYALPFTESQRSQKPRRSGGEPLQQR